MDIMDRIATGLKTRFSSDPAIGEFEVEARSNYDHSDPNDKIRAGFTFIVKNPTIETDPVKAEQHLLAQLASIEALQPYLKTESEKSHMERMARELSEFIKLEAELNEKSTGIPVVSIPPEYAKWFEELPKRSDWNLKNALKISKGNTGVLKIEIEVPANVDASTIATNIESRKEAILEMLANRVVKYTPEANTDEKKDTLKAQVKALQLIIAPEEGQWGKGVSIQIMTQAQLDATKLPGGIPTDKIAELSAANPLLSLKNGEKEDEVGPDGKPHPPHLQKALSRSFLFAGEKHNEIFPLIAGKDDMRRAIAKSLVNLNKRQPENTELAKKIDAFLSDDVFKNPDRWGTPVEERESFKEAPRFLKMGREIGAKPYTKGEMAIELNVPADKFTEIRDQLAALDGQQQQVTPTAEKPAETPAAPTADDKLAVAGQTVKTGLGATEKVPAFDPTTIAAAEAAKKTPPEGPAAAAR